MAHEQNQRISEVIAREYSRLRNFIRRRVPDPRDAEDIRRPLRNREAMCRAHDRVRPSRCNLR